jgi:hypothetical protein
LKSDFRRIDPQQARIIESREILGETSKLR